MSVCVMSPESPFLFTTGSRRTFILSITLIASSRVASSLMVDTLLVIASCAASFFGSLFSASTRFMRSRSVIIPTSCSFSSTITQLMCFSVMSLIAFVSLSFVCTLIAPLVMMSLTVSAGIAFLWS